jgi:hypothetical protein
METLLNRDPSASLEGTFGRVGGCVQRSIDVPKSLCNADRLRRTVKLDMDMAQVIFSALSIL